MGRTLSMASSLSARGRPSTGSKDGGAVGEDRGFFPFSACFGAMAVKRAEHNQIGRTERNQIGRTEQGLEEAGRLEEPGVAKEE